MRAAVKPGGEEYYEYILCCVDDILCMLMKAKEVMAGIGRRSNSRKRRLNHKLSRSQIRKKTLDGFDMWTMSSYD